MPPFPVKAVRMSHHRVSSDFQKRGIDSSAPPNPPPLRPNKIPWLPLTTTPRNGGLLSLFGCVRSGIHQGRTSLGRAPILPVAQGWTPMWLVAGAAEAIPPAERQSCVAMALMRWMWNTREIWQRQMRDTAIIPARRGEDN